MSPRKNARKLIVIAFGLLVGVALLINVVRVNAAGGDLETTFNPGTGADNGLQTMVLQPDGKIIIGGYFTSYNGTSRNYIARVNSNGSLDTSFDPGTGAGCAVYASVLQSDGKVIIGGCFTDYNGTTRNRIARLNADGSLDTTFDPGTGADGTTVFTIALQSDGKVIIGGNFNNYNGTARKGVARLNSDGSLDTTFDPGTGADSFVLATALQPDGKIIIGGFFTSYNGTSRNYIARVNSNGSLDTSFDPGTGAGCAVYASVLQSDGKVIIGGCFTDYNGTTRNRIARLNADGSLDTTFNRGTGAAATTVFTIALQS